MSERGKKLSALSVRKYVVRMPAEPSADLDESENVWIWAHPATGTFTDAAIVTDLLAFYNAGTTPVASILSPVLDRSANVCSVTGYEIGANLNGSPAGAPVFFQTFTLGASGGSASAALQLAVVAEYSSDMTGVVEFGTHARPRARRRGRHFFGPITNTHFINTGSPSFNPAWDTVVTGSIHDASVALLASTNFGPGWSVWSRVDAATHVVLRGKIDSTIRTRRKRVIPTAIPFTTWP